MQHCVGICGRYRPKKISGTKHISNYLLGRKKCRTCGTWMQYDGKHCPCCTAILATKPREKKLNKDREMLRY